MIDHCKNLLVAQSKDPENIDYIIDYIIDNLGVEPNYIEKNTTEFEFTSKWVFPKNEMDELFDNIPNKENIYIRCLSYELDTLYHALWECDKNGWKEV